MHQSNRRVAVRQLQASGHPPLEPALHTRIHLNLAPWLKRSIPAVSRTEVRCHSLFRYRGGFLWHACSKFWLPKVIDMDGCRYRRRIASHSSRQGALFSWVDMFPLPEWQARMASTNGPRRGIFHNHRACANNRPFPDFYAWMHECLCRNPSMRTDRNRLHDKWESIALKIMRASAKMRPLGNHRPTPNRNFSLTVKNHAVRHARLGTDF